MRRTKTTDDLVALLSWYQDMGVDACLDTSPTNWLAKDNAVPGYDLLVALRAQATSTRRATSSRSGASTAAAPSSQYQPPAIAKPPTPQPAPARRFPTTAPTEAVTSARNAARSAKSLTELGQLLEAFDGCALKATAKHLCFYRGAAQAQLMIIGEAPGRDEDLAGKPFVGRAGMLLDKMLDAIGLDESNVHITNVVYWRPPGNRTPTPQETQICRPFLERQIELVSPEVILLLGGAAAKTIFGVSDGIMRLRGKWRKIRLGEKEFKTIATLHPAYLLRTSIAKRLAWRDLQKVRATI